MIHNESGGDAMPDKCPLVIIRWQDSRQPCGSWRYLSALPPTTAVEVATVGWLLRDDPDVKVVCQNVGDLDHPQNAQASGIMTIPTRCVLSVERLTEDGTIFSAAAVAAIADDRETGSARTQPAL
ncbi:MAG: hypothetical protein K8F92_19620 [Hyphomicrobium sp.]|uniref:hypothetical protein n=1 Tax=Hyphomicrobium sp. TaxID=82 RepID=UPI0025BA5277|nr:hypothetical protein [Hyphomicrobium sp.]MBZ0211842.1 hypothetical protein [Hyphomicrobium sp.]